MPPIPEYFTAWTWWWTHRRAARAELLFIYHPPIVSVGLRRVRVYEPDGLDVGTFVWQICSDCRCGIINKISLCLSQQRRGLGRRLVHRALSDGPDYLWSTSGQSPDAQQFFPVLAAETGHAFTARGAACDHIASERSHPGLGAKQTPKPRLDPMTFTPTSR